MSAMQKKWYVETGRLISKLQKTFSQFEAGVATVKTSKKPAKQKVAVAVGETRRGRKADPNSKSQMVKTYFEKYGFDHPLKAVAETLTKKHGQEFTIGLVANIKHRLGGTNHREAKSSKKETKAPKAKVKVSKKESVVSKKGGPSLSEVVAKTLADSVEGLKLSEITEKVKSSNYEYRGGKEIEGLRSNIWQCLNKMKKEGSHKGYEGTQPVVIHNSEDKKYLINPKANRRVA